MGRHSELRQTDMMGPKIPRLQQIFGQAVIDPLNGGSERERARTAHIVFVARLAIRRDEMRITLVCAIKFKLPHKSFPRYININRNRQQMYVTCGASKKSY